jgi:hypothetical protein
MFSELEIIGVVVALIGAAVLAFYLQKAIGGVEDTMNEMRENERDSSPAIQTKPIRHTDPRRKRR